MRKYRLPPIRDEPWDGDEKAKILVMNIYEEAFYGQTNTLPHLIYPVEIYN